MAGSSHESSIAGQMFVEECTRTSTSTLADAADTPPEQANVITDALPGLPSVIVWS